MQRLIAQSYALGDSDRRWAEFLHGRFEVAALPLDLGGF